MQDEIVGYGKSSRFFVRNGRQMQDHRTVIVSMIMWTTIDYQICERGPDTNFPLQKNILLPAQVL